TSRVPRGGARALLARDLPARAVLLGGRGAVLSWGALAQRRAVALLAPVHGLSRAPVVAFFALDPDVAYRRPRDGADVRASRGSGRVDRRALPHQPAQPQLHRPHRAAGVMLGRRFPSTISRTITLSWALSFTLAGAHADELSGADKLRMVYSNQFSWTQEGL